MFQGKDSKTGSPTPSGGTPSPPPGRSLGHQFVAIPYNIASVQCHVCSKSVANKAVLRCELCLVAVHEHSCRDQIADCTKFKSLLPKVGGTLLPATCTSLSHSLSHCSSRPNFCLRVHAHSCSLINSFASSCRPLLPPPLTTETTNG